MIYSLKGKIHPCSKLTLKLSGGYSRRMDSHGFDKIRSMFRKELKPQGNLVVKSYNFVKYNLFTN